MLKFICRKMMQMTEDNEDIDLSKRDEMQVRLDNNRCPRCMVELKRQDMVKKICWACGLIVLDAMEDKKQ